MLLKAHLKQQGTNARAHAAAEKRRKATKTPWNALCRFFCERYGLKWDDLFCAVYRNGSWFSVSWAPKDAARNPTAVIPIQAFPFLLLASQRVTNLTIDKAMASLGIDEWDALAGLRDAERRLKSDEPFAERFEVFLDACKDREQAFTVQENYAKTYEEIGEELGICWQRVQQIEKTALKKIRKALRNDPDLAFVLAELLGGRRDLAFTLNEEEEEPS